MAQPAAERMLTLKDMTGAVGCTPRTVRYYERQGLLRAARSAGGHRLFAATELERLHFIIALREAGWALEDIEGLLDARDRAPSDHAAAGRLHEMLHTQIGRLEQKLALLTTLREDLRRTDQAIQICHECTSDKGSVECGSCDRLPQFDELPRGFRLTWRDGSTTAGVFDEADAAATVTK